MLKKYWSREHEDRVHVSHAMVVKPEKADEDEFVDILMGLKSDISLMLT